MNIPIVIPRTKQTKQEVPSTTFEELDVITQNSRKAQELWAKISLKERSIYFKNYVKILKNEADSVAKKISEYNGKTEEEALVAEIFPTLSCFQYFSGRVRNKLKAKSIFINALPFADSKIEFTPIGVIGLITPWNYPFMLSLQDVPAALMAGNSIIIKPSEHQIFVKFLIDELFEKAGFPENLVQVISGYGDLGSKLIEKVDYLGFTGSTKTGKIVAQKASSHLIPYHLELGGKDPALVLEDAPIKETVEGITWSAFCNLGQTCASVERVYIPQSRKDEFTQTFKNYLDSLDPSNFGTMNTSFQKEIVEKQLAKIDSKKLHIKKIGEGENICQPTIIIDPPRDSSLFREESFGPVLPITFYNDLPEAINSINDSPYGLTASIWAKDISKAKIIAKKIQSGTITFNDHMITPGFPEVPWVGHKESGIGFSHSYMSLQKFSKIKSFYYDRGLISFKFWRYPWNSKKKAWVHQFLDYQFGSLWSKIKGIFLTLPQLLRSKI